MTRFPLTVETLLLTSNVARYQLKLLTVSMTPVLCLCTGDVASVQGLRAKLRPDKHRRVNSDVALRKALADQVARIEIIAHIDVHTPLAGADHILLDGALTEAAYDVAIWVRTSISIRLQIIGEMRLKMQDQIIVHTILQIPGSSRVLDWLQVIQTRALQSARP